MNARPQRRRVSKAARERGEQLLAAAKSNSLPRVQQVLHMLGPGEGVDVGRDPIRAATPLFWAVDQDNAAMTTALLNAGADVNATDNCTSRMLPRLSKCTASSTCRSAQFEHQKQRWMVGYG